MRKIWFRAKSLDDSSKFFYGDLMHDGGKSCCLYFESDGSDIAVDPDTVGQFTGMYDCDGKEIYEGDILQNLRYTDIRRQVIWYHGCWAIDCIENTDEEPELLYNILKAFDMQVIGNIYETPETFEIEKKISEGAHKKIRNCYI